MTLTAAQAELLGHLTAEPAPAFEIAARAGVPTPTARQLLMALRAKGLVERHLNPTTWSLAPAATRLVADATGDEIRWHTEPTT